MIPRGLFSQIALILLAVLIIFSYVKPKMQEIKSVQDTIMVYKQEEQKVTDVNQKLTKLKSKINDISEEDKHKLLAYMPNEVDTIAVPRDIESIVTGQEAILKSVKYLGMVKGPVGEAVTTQALETPSAHQFSVVTAGSYLQLKAVFAALERNAYPLEVSDLHISQTAGGFLQADFKLTTYSRRLTTIGEDSPSGVQPK
jgi:hypothetical protein